MPTAQGQGFRGDALLGKIQQHVVLAQREMLEALIVLGEQFPQVAGLDLRGVGRQGLPGRRSGGAVAHAYLAYLRRPPAQKCGGGGRSLPG